MIVYDHRRIRRPIVLACAQFRFSIFPLLVFALCMFWKCYYGPVEHFLMGTSLILPNELAIASCSIKSLSWWSWGCYNHSTARGHLLLGGHTSPQEHAELEWPIDLMIVLVWVLYAVLFFGTLLSGKWAISSWLTGFLVAIIVVAMIFILWTILRCRSRPWSPTCVRRCSRCDCSMVVGDIMPLVYWPLVWLAWITISYPKQRTDQSIRTAVCHSFLGLGRLLHMGRDTT